MWRRREVSVWELWYLDELEGKRWETKIKLQAAEQSSSQTDSKSAAGTSEVIINTHHPAASLFISFHQCFRKKKVSTELQIKPTDTPERILSIKKKDAVFKQQRRRSSVDWHVILWKLVVIFDSSFIFDKALRSAVKTSLSFRSWVDYLNLLHSPLFSVRQVWSLLSPLQLLENVAIYLVQVKKKVSTVLAFFFFCSFQIQNI